MVGLIVGKDITYNIMWVFEMLLDLHTIWGNIYIWKQP